MSAPLRFRILLVSLVAVIQVATVAGALILQNRVAEDAMLARGHERLDGTTARVRGSLVRDAAPFRAAAEILARDLAVRALDPRAGWDGAAAMAVRLLAALARSPDVETASVVFHTGVTVEMRRDGIAGFVLVQGAGTRGDVMSVTTGDQGRVQFHLQGTTRMHRATGTRWFAATRRSPGVVLGVDEASGSLVAAKLTRYGSAPVVVAVRSRPGLLADALTAEAPSAGGFVAILPRTRSLDGVVAGGSTGVSGRGRSGELRQALRYASRVDGEPGFRRVSFDGRTMLARVTPFVAGQLTGDVVALAPVDELTQGSGSVVTSTRLAVLAGLLAGLLVLPLVFRATRPVAAMHRKATIDPLTGLVNRAELARRGARVLRRARGGGGLAAVAVLDLDGFKEINDRHGHQTGDEVLRAFAGRLRAAVRSGDVVARLGGDEFVVVLAGRAGRVTGEVFDRLLDDCQARPVSTSSGGHVVLCTVGYADDTAGDGDLDELIARADAALIAGKANRKGRVYRAGPAGVAVASAA